MNIIILAVGVVLWTLVAITAINAINVGLGIPILGAFGLTGLVLAFRAIRRELRP